MNNPIAMGMATGIISFLASALTSHFTMGDLNLVPALVGGIAFGFTFGILMQWKQSKESHAKTKRNDSQ